MLDKPVSIIIPAHNENKVIKSTLSALLPGIKNNSIEVIVVCNGCSDDTAIIVKSIHKSIICIEIPQASKSIALNTGDAAASFFPRIYQDADIVLSMDTIRMINIFFQHNSILAASPCMKMEFHKSSWAVRSYYEIWGKLPYVREGFIGVGAYAVSEEGRKRFRCFPNIIADDGYIRSLFKAHERSNIENCFSLVRAPKNIRGLIKIKTRSRRGGYELSKKFPELICNEKKQYRESILGILKSAQLWPKLIIYLYINIVSRYFARINSFIPGGTKWERDESSRNVDSI